MSSYVDQVLAAIELGGNETPAQLRQRASGLMGAFLEAVMVPTRLASEMSLLEARADALEQRDSAAAVLAQAQAHAADAEAEYAATAPAEEDAARRATAAGMRSRRRGMRWRRPSRLMPSQPS